MILLLVVLVLLSAVVPVQASTLQEYREKANQIGEERKELLQQLKAAGKEERVQLTIEANKLASYQEAYEKAVEYATTQATAHGIYGNTTGLLKKGVPSQFIPIYQAAGEKYGVDWFLLASIHKIETQFSSLSSMISYAGAVGHMQFMPATWEMYGVDANQDGKKDPWNVEDAIHAAANYLAATGAADGRVKEAVWHYNHADWYVEEVVSVAAAYKAAYTQNETQVLNVGKRYINNSVYVFGGGRNSQDIAKGYFDCSSFVHWAFAQVGQDLGPLTSVTTDTLKGMGQQVDPANLQPGDLVFFDTYKPDGHVGIYAGNGMFLGAQSGSGVAFADMTKGFWKDTFNGRVKRL